MPDCAHTNTQCTGQCCIYCTNQIVLQDCLCHRRAHHSFLRASLQQSSKPAHALQGRYEISRDPRGPHERGNIEQDPPGFEQQNGGLHFQIVPTTSNSRGRGRGQGRGRGRNDGVDGMTSQLAGVSISGQGDWLGDESSASQQPLPGTGEFLVVSNGGRGQVSG